MVNNMTKKEKILKLEQELDLLLEKKKNLLEKEKNRKKNLEYLEDTKDYISRFYENKEGYSEYRQTLQASPQRSIGYGYNALELDFNKIKAKRDYLRMWMEHLKKETEKDWESGIVQVENDIKNIKLRLKETIASQIKDKKEKILEVGYKSSILSGEGRVSIHTMNSKELGVGVGDIIEIIGKKRTGAMIYKLKTEDEEKGIIKIDETTGVRAGVFQGDLVKVKKAEVEDAQKVVLAVSDEKQLEMWKELNWNVIVELLKNIVVNTPTREGEELFVWQTGLNWPKPTKKSSFKVLETVPKNAFVLITDKTDITILKEIET